MSKNYCYSETLAKAALTIGTAFIDIKLSKKRIKEDIQIFKNEFQDSPEGKY